MSNKALLFIFILICAIPASFFAGIEYQKSDQKQPCIRNFVEPQFSGFIQNYIDSDNEELQNSIINALSKDEIYTRVIGNIRIHYYVPSYCYVEETFSGPVLWKK
jgi:hypothetical protein